MCRAVIKVIIDAALDLARAVEPDNKSAPPGIMVRCSGASVLECVIEVDCTTTRGLLTLRNTVDDLIQALQAAESALSASS